MSVSSLKDQSKNWTRKGGGSKPPVKESVAAGQPNIPVTWEYITPDVARQYLACNLSDNRRKKEVLIRRLITALRDKYFRLTHQGIAFEPGGRLIDGQNRLTAIVATGIGAWLPVARNVPLSHIEAVDVGCMRTDYDLVRAATGEAITRKAIAVAKYMTAGNDSSLRGGYVAQLKGRPAVDLYIRHREAVDFACNSHPTAGYMPAKIRALVARAYYYADHDRLQAFLDVLATGAVADARDSAAKRLYDHLRTREVLLAAHTDPAAVVKKAAMALKAFLEYRPIEKLVQLSVDPWPPIPDPNATEVASAGGTGPDRALGSLLPAWTTRPAITFAWELVTPETAALWLNARMANYRPVKTHVVARLEDALKSDHFVAIHQGIGFTPDGELGDGQNRLLAIANTGIAAWLLVARNVPRESFDAVDIGVVRNDSDQLRITTGVKVGKDRISIARHMTVPIELAHITSRSELTGHRLREFMAVHAEAIEFAAAVGGHAKGVPAAVRGQVAKAYYVADRDRLRQFLAILVDGVAGPDDQAAIKLRDYCHSPAGRSAGSAARAILMRKTAAALSAFLQRRTLKALQEISVDPWPLPKS